MARERLSLRLQMAPPTEQVQPDPDIETRVSPGGSSSLTVTVPLVVAKPMLLTRMLNVMPVPLINIGAGEYTHGQNG